MKTLIILSDTHGKTLLVNKILNNNDYDIAIHAGDYECDVDYMIKKFDYFVSGNNDFDEQSNELYFNIEGISFYLQHGHLLGSHNDLDGFDYMSDIINRLNVDVLIHGHTHKTKVLELSNNKFIVNPGSTTFPRGTTEASYLIATIKNGKINFEIKLVKELQGGKRC